MLLRVFIGHRPTYLPSVEHSYFTAAAAFAETVSKYKYDPKDHFGEDMELVRYLVLDSLDHVPEYGRASVAGLLERRSDHRLLTIVTADNHKNIRDMYSTSIVRRINDGIVINLK